MALKFCVCCHRQKPRDDGIGLRIDTAGAACGEVAFGYAVLKDLWGSQRNQPEIVYPPTSVSVKL